MKRNAPNLRTVFAKAVRHHEAGRIEAAAELARQVLAADPGHTDALHLLGVIALGAGRFDLAAGMIERAVALNPWNPAYHSNLGLAFRELGRLAESGLAYRRALEVDPRFVEAHYNLGNVLKEMGRHADAAACYRAAIALKPAFAEAHCNLGVALEALGRLDEAAACQRQALALKPGFPDAQNNLGSCLAELGHQDDALACFRAVIAGHPGHVAAHRNLGQILLRAGDFRAGWPEYAWRWQEKNMAELWRSYGQAPWTGDAAGGRTILIWREQGLGDVIQCLRYLPVLAGLGWRVILEAPPELQRLAETIPGVTVVAAGNPLPAFDVHCPILNLPGLLGTEIESIPTGVPYLTPAARDVAIWRDRLSAAGALTVGIAWRGNATHKRDRLRSMTARRFADFLGHEGLRLVSLQKDATAEELAVFGPGHCVDAGPLLDDFADTAALMAEIDLVVSIDSSVCHLAGALGRPVWTLIDYAADWRWLAMREDSPWYPTMRLFRQPSRGDWESVAASVRQALAARVSPPIPV